MKNLIPDLVNRTDPDTLADWIALLLLATRSHWPPNLISDLRSRAGIAQTEPTHTKANPSVPLAADDEQSL